MSVEPSDPDVPSRPRFIVDGDGLTALPAASTVPGSPRGRRREPPAAAETAGRRSVKVAGDLPPPRPARRVRRMRRLLLRVALLGATVVALAVLGFVALLLSTGIPAARVPLQQLIIEDVRGVRLATVITGRSEERLALEEIAPIARDAVVAAVSTSIRVSIRSASGVRCGRPCVRARFVRAGRPSPSSTSKTSTSAIRRA